MLAAAMPTQSVRAQDMSYDAYIQLLKAKARAQGVSEGTISRMTAGLTPNQRVIRLDKGQPGTPTRRGYPALAPYPAEIIVAIFGHETSYGRIRGNFDLSRSLSTLAWEGRRRELFESEFLALLKVADKGYSRSTLVGSWAGAFGNPQFLPSVYLRLAVDGDGEPIISAMPDGARASHGACAPVFRRVSIGQR